MNSPIRQDLAGLMPFASQDDQVSRLSPFEDLANSQETVRLNPLTSRLAAKPLLDRFENL